MTTERSIAAELQEQHARLAAHFKPGFLQRPLTRYQFEFIDGEPFYLEVSEAGFSLTPGRTEAPTLTVTISNHESCWQLLLGQRDGMDAFMRGDYRADSHIVLSQLLLYLFKPDDPTLIYEVQD